MIYMKLNIKAANGGKFYNYTITREVYLGLAGQIYDLSVAKSKSDNAKSGALVSQSLHAYGCTGERETAYGEAVFPEAGGEFTVEHAENWLEAMEMKQKREKRPLAERQAKWDEDHAKLSELAALRGDSSIMDYLSPKSRPIK